MKFALLDTVVLNRDLPEHGLRAGDLGAVVELYGADGVEVEFVQPSGQTKALVTLQSGMCAPSPKATSSRFVACEAPGSANDVELENDRSGRVDPKGRG
jgi:hypothetical protein